MSPTLSRPVSSPQRRRTRAALQWRDRAIAEGVRTARAGLRLTYAHYEPIANKDKISKARTEYRHGCAEGYFQLLVAAWHAGDFEGLWRLANGPRDFAEQLTAGDALPIGTALMAEQEADAAEDIAEARLAFSSTPEAAWEYLFALKAYEATIPCTKAAVRKYIADHDIPRPVDTRYRKPGAVISGAAS